MKSLNEWRDSSEGNEKINADMTYLKSLLGKSSGRADPELVGQIKTKIAQAKENYAKQASTELGEVMRYEELPLEKQYDFFLNMMEAVITISLPESWRSGKNWNSQKIKRFGVQAERPRVTVPNPAPTPPMPPSGPPTQNKG